MEALNYWHTVISLVLSHITGLRIQYHKYGGQVRVGTDTNFHAPSLQLDAAN